MSKPRRNNNKGNGNRRDSDKPNKFKDQANVTSEDDGMKGDKKDPKFKGYRNDASDYIPDSTIRAQVGHFSYNTTIGIPDTYQVSVAGQSPIIGSSEIGAVMEIQMFTNIGMDHNTIGTNIPVMGINAAALRLYNMISADNGKTTKELPEDIAMAIVMVGELVSAIANYQRAYGTAFAANYRNRTVPKLLIKAMGFDPDNFFEHLSDSRLRMNRLLSIATNIQLPVDIKWFKRSWELYSHVFYDKGSAMGQYYVTRPVGFFKYYEQYDPSLADPRQLVEGKFYPLSDDMSVDVYLDVVEDMLHRILESSLFNYVFTDIIRFMQRKGGNVLGFNFIPEFYTLAPEFSETFMNQVHNMSWGMFTNVDDTYVISDEPLALSLRSNLTVGVDNVNLAKCVGGDQIIDFPYTDNPDYDQAIDALAFKTIVDYYEAEGVSAGTFRLCAVPPHPVHKVYVHYLYTSDATLHVERREVQYGLTTTIDYIFPTWETFDVKPVIWKYYGDSSPKVPIGSLNFWTSVSQAQLSRILDFYFLGLFEAFTLNT